MTVLLFLVPISLLLAGIGVALFAWAVRDGQFDDLDTPPLDVLSDEPEADHRDHRSRHHRR